MKRLLAILLFAVALPAQTEKPQAEKPQRPAPSQAKPAGNQLKVFSVKYADVFALRNIFKSLGFAIEADNSLRIITASASPAELATIEETIRKVDVPDSPKELQNVELAFYWIRTAETDGPLPDQVKPVADELRRTIEVRGLQLLDVQMTRMRSDAVAELTSIVAFDSAKQPGRSTIRVDQVKLNPAEVTLRVSTQLAVPADASFRDVLINTRLSVKPGQTTVIGRSSLAGPSRAAFLVIQARLLD